MKRIYVLAPLVLVLAVASGVVQAGPPVDVTFKNNAAESAFYHAEGRNGMSTQMNARPTPLAEIKAGEFARYRVQSNISSDTNYAVVVYRMGSKVCKFSTTYFKNFQSGVRVPKWTKNAIAEGGARCDVKITSVNFSTNAWAVEFSMR